MSDKNDIPADATFYILSEAQKVKMIRQYIRDAEHNLARLDGARHWLAGVGDHRLYETAARLHAEIRNFADMFEATQKNKPSARKAITCDHRQSIEHQDKVCEECGVPLD